MLWCNENCHRVWKKSWKFCQIWKVRILGKKNKTQAIRQNLQCSSYWVAISVWWLNSPISTVHSLDCQHSHMALAALYLDLLQGKHLLLWTGGTAHVLKAHKPYERKPAWPTRSVKYGGKGEVGGEKENKNRRKYYLSPFNSFSKQIHHILSLTICSFETFCPVEKDTLKRKKIGYQVSWCITNCPQSPTVL